MKAQLLLIYLGVVTVLAGFGGTVPCHGQDTNGATYLIPIRGPITRAQLFIIRRGLNEANASEAGAIVLLMDTPGGELKTTGEIMRMLKGIEVPTYTYVEHDAFSAGAIIAMGTREIYMAPNSKIGDAMPIMVPAGGAPVDMPEALQEKMVSAVVAMIRSAAQHNGHDPRVGEAMVRREMELIIDDTVICPTGQLLTLTNIDAERLVGEEQRPLLSQGTVSNITDLLETIGRADAPRIDFEISQSEVFASYLEGIAAIVLALGIFGIYIELRTPGFGIPGVLGILMLAIWFWAQHVAGLAGIPEFTFFFIGLALLLLELFVIPGFGVAGFLGIGCMFVALLMAMVQRYPGTPWYPTLPDFPNVGAALLELTFAMAGVAAIILLSARFLPDSPLFRRLILSKATSRDAGYVADRQAETDLVGLSGRTITQLHPAGAGMFGERRLDIVSRGEFIEDDRPVTIIETAGNRIVVKETKDSPT